MSRTAITERSRNKVKGLTVARTVWVMTRSNLPREGADPSRSLV